MRENSKMGHVYGQCLVVLSSDWSKREAATGSEEAGLHWLAQHVHICKMVDKGG